MRRLVVFRADASAEIGTGHVQRCLALARTLAGRGWTAAFAVGDETVRAVPTLSQFALPRLTVAGSQQDEIQSMRKQWPDGCDVVVVDHYGRNADYEKATRGWARHVAAIEDVPVRHHDADVLIDPTAGRTRADYRGLVPEGAKVFTGADYILLRDAITSEPRSEVAVPAKAKSLFVCFGGSDPDDLTSRALTALRDPRLAGMAATVVIGAANPRAAILGEAASANVTAAVDPPNLAGLMASADIAVAGSGTMAWELAYYGVPSLLVIHSRGNVVPALVEAGAARFLGELDAATPEAIAAAVAALADDKAARSAMRAAGRALVDGRGTERVSDAIEEVAA